MFFVTTLPWSPIFQAFSEYSKAILFKIDVTHWQNQKKGKSRLMKRIKVLKVYFIIWLFILFIVYANFELLSTFFMATVVFSSAVLGVLSVGTLYQLMSGYGIVMLGGTFGALAYKKTGYEFYLRSIDKILPANIAHMLYSRKNQQKMLFTQDESRNIVDWLEDKFRKQKSYINFFINTSMLIGLLGTFVGLVESIDEMGQIILSLNGDVNIQKVMQDFSGPLTGMAIGFGASLFGVVTAVILGINGYVLFRYQDTLIDGIEDWLKDRIIDVVPESLGASNQGGALPEQRKSFMDVFIEQMESFTTEISRMSQSNSSITVMSDSLSSIKHLMESERESIKLMLEQQERHYANFEAFTRAFISSKEESERRLSEDRAALYALLQNNTKVIERSDAALHNIDSNIVSIEQNIAAQKESVGTLNALGERVAREQDRMHMETVEALGALNSAVSNEVRIISSFAAKNDEKNQQISAVLEEISSSSRAIEQRVDRSNQALANMLSVQEREYEAIAKNNSDMHASMIAVNDSVKNQTSVLSDFVTIQDGVNKKYLHTQAQILDVLENTSSLVSKEQESLSVLIALQNDGKQEAGRRFAEAINSASEINRQLTGLKASIDEILKSQNDNASKQAGFNDAISSSVQKLNDHLLVGSEKNDRAISVSEDALNAQREGFATLVDSLSRVVMEIAKVETKISEYVGEHMEFQTNTVKVQEDRQGALMSELASQAENTQETLRQIARNIEAIGEKISEFDPSLLGTSGNSDKKGFFSSLFGKN